MSNLCPSCNSEMKLIPAGVSKKSGKPYQAFLSCPNRCAKPGYGAMTPNSPQNASGGQMGALEAKLDRIIEKLEILEKAIGDKTEKTSEIPFRSDLR